MPIDEDWEEEHEKLAEYQGDTGITPASIDGFSLEDDEECAYKGLMPSNLKKAQYGGVESANLDFECDNEDAANVAANVSRMILDDDDIESILSRPINYPQSMESKVCSNYNLIIV